MPLIALINTWTRPDRWPLIGALGSAALLAGAFAFEILGNYPPCPLCIQQRWVHAYVLIAGLALGVGFHLAEPVNALVYRAGATIMAVGFAASTWAGAHHAGGEYGLWRLDCAGGSVSDLTVEGLLDALNTATNVVLCDEPAWTLLGVSMAGYNALFSAALCAISIFATFRTPTRSA